MRFNFKLHKVLKKVLAYILYYIGAVFFAQQFLFKDKCIILVYHRVVSPFNDTIHVQDGMYVEPDVFREHINYLKDHFNIISEQELVDILKQKKDFNKACHITFDDGWIDNFQHAYPILIKEKVPATIFIASGFIGTSEWFWPEKVIFFIESIDLNAISKIKDENIRLLISAYYNNASKDEAILNQIIEYLKYTPEHNFNTVIDDLTTYATKSIVNNRQVLNWDEIIAMHEHSITFGSHTVHHTILTGTTDMDRIRYELEHSKETIETHTHSKIKSFCFPNGNSSETLIDEVKHAGYDMAYIGGRGVNDRKTDPFRLKRIGIHNDIAYNKPLFACRLLFSFF